MGNRQSLAKIGVMVLLGINVGAYYLFWPHPKESRPTPANVPMQEAKGPTLPVLPEVAKPAPLAASGGVVLNLPSPAPQDPEEAVHKLLEQIKKDADGPNEQKRNLYEVPPTDFSLQLTQATSTKPGFLATDPLPLPPLKATPLNDDRPDPDVATTSALTAKSRVSPWVLHEEKAGTQTRLIAKLPGKAPVEFEIFCESVGLKGSDSLEAVGKVTFAGGGIKGTCDRLTVPLWASQLVLEGQVQIAQEPGQLRGERFVWEMPAAAEAAPTTPTSRAVLGAPR